MKRRLSARAVTILTAALAAGWLLPGPRAAAAGDAPAAFGEANAAYRAAEKAFFAGKTEEAETEVARARELIARAEAADPADHRIGALKAKTEKLAGRIAAKTAPAPETGSAGRTVPQAPGDALPGSAATLLRDIDRSLDRAERALDGAAGSASAQDREQAARFQLRQAQDAWETIQKRHGAKIAPGNPEMAARYERMSACASRIDEFVREQAELVQAAAGAAAAAEAASGPWIARMGPFVTSPYQAGHDPDRYLTASASMDEGEMRGRLRIYAEASRTYGEYRAAAPAAKTPELLEIEQQLAGALDSFRNSMREYGERELEEIGRRLDEAGIFLETQAAGSGAGGTFSFLQADILPDLGRRIERAGIFLLPGDGRTSRLRERLSALLKTDAELRRRRVAETRMRPQLCSGPAAQAAAKKGSEIVENARPGAEVLRVAVVSPDWKEESVLEYTDTTGSALRHRVTRSLTVEVAAREKAETILHTLEVGSDRRSDGSWGELYGHIMFSRPILEENVFQ